MERFSFSNHPFPWGRKTGKHFINSDSILQCYWFLNAVLVTLFYLNVVGAF